MNLVLLVVDSLRAGSLGRPDGPRTPFLERLARETVTFTRAYATECWTLPAHASLFTGLLPSAHGAHFQTMAYARPTPTVAERLASAGLHTEVITRNSIFDGSIPGITRGFRKNTQVLSPLRGLNPLAILLALSKPRFRRQIRTTGFFHPRQRASRAFVTTFARATVPADRLALDYLLEQMAMHRRGGRASFFFVNLYDVHAPYPPSPRSIFRSWGSVAGCRENLRAPFVLPCLGGHAYLRPGFRLSAASRRMLLGRYHAAIELMDASLAAFFTAARRLGLLDDTAVILTSDHGEGFGEHGLYLHDAALYETHLHVPLYVHHPDVPPMRVDDVVTTRDLFGLLRAIGLDEDRRGTLLEAAYRATHPIALAEHFHYPHAEGADPRYRQDLVAAIAGTEKVILRREGVERYDLARDPDEQHPSREPLAAFAAACRRQGLDRPAVDDALAHLRAWQARGAGGPTNPVMRDRASAALATAAGR